jgi:hypothetical protein
LEGENFPFMAVDSMKMAFERKRAGESAEFIMKYQPNNLTVCPSFGSVKKDHLRFSRKGRRVCF